MTPKLSASRLNDYLGCSHHTALWLAGVEPGETSDPSLDLVRRKGFEHEAAVLDGLEAKYGPARRIPGTGPSDGRLRETAEAISEGALLIYQAALKHGAWIGYPDFLIRGDLLTDGQWSYRAEDAKLARRAKPSHVLQLNVYGSLLQEAHGIPLSDGVIHVGGGLEPEAFDLSKTSTIAKRYMTEFEAFAALPERQTKPVRVGACGQCPFSLKCESEWRAADSPVFVAGIRNDQMLKLEEAGVTTLTALAKLKPAAPVPNLALETRNKLVAQARLQATYAKTGKHVVEPLLVEDGRGFKTLPSKATGDLFFDMEGDPLFPEGLEYLFGIWGPVADPRKSEFKAFWAHDHAAEKRAFEDTMRFFSQHLTRFPDAHIYHYAAYEVTAFKRLAMRYATMEAELDQMLRDHKFVDLYRITRQAIRASTESYSLKDLEKIYWNGRTGDVANAGDSIVEYERWRELGDQNILDAIKLYNAQDCTSTERLRDWLEQYRPDDGGFALPGGSEDVGREDSAERQALERDRQAIAASVRASDFAEAPVRDLVCELMWFHQRTAKPAWWAVFDRQTWSDDELVEDFESLGALTLDPDFPPRTEQRSFVTTYRFPPQETKLEEGDTCRIALTSEPAGTIVSLDINEGRVSLKRGTNKGGHPETCSLGPSGPLQTKVLAAAVVEVARRLAQGDLETDQALLDLLARHPPRLAGAAVGRSIIAGTGALLDEAVDAVRKLDRTCLIIQGPPGTGKTFTTAHAIVALLKDGKRVGVTSNSHKAINNVLKTVEKVAKKQAFAFRGVKKASNNNPESEFDGEFVHSVLDSGEVSGADALVGGTPFHFARPDQWGRYDYLFVDEAGQVALGNLAAMSAVATNIVLVGDQMQLDQPVQGVHPGESGQSCLGYAMQDHATVPPERGILLNVTWRMHPDVCAFISDTIYDSRLTPESSTARRVLVLDGTADPRLKTSGLSCVLVEHLDCIQSSAEEAQVVLELVRGLLRQKRRTTEGEIVPMTLADLVVVAPYNLQVNLLRRTLPAGARVGTVDKFQGQEAAVAIVSMATSRGDEAPRGTDFLFNTNRINVALSRAESVAVLVCGSQLLDFVGNNIPDLWRLNVFAKAEAL